LLFLYLFHTSALFGIPCIPINVSVVRRLEQSKLIPANAN